MTSRPASPLASLATLMWPLYLACTALVALVWVSGFGPGMLASSDLQRKLPGAELRTALALFSRALDPAWITLGAANAYFAVVRAEGLSRARRWCALVLAGAFTISALSAATRWPLGPVYFPSNLGIKIGPVPFALPFLWLLIIAGARDTVRRVFPVLRDGASAAIVGACCAVTHLLLDPIAWKVRAWWLWYPAPLPAANTAPWQSHVAWFAGGCIAALTLRPHAHSFRPTWIRLTAAPVYLVFLGVVILAHIVRALS